jgi:hypothetical protein
MTKFNLRYLFPERIKEINHFGIITNYQFLSWGEILPFDWNDFKKKVISVGTRIEIVDCFDLGFNCWKMITLK